MAAVRKWGLLELVLWDVILAAVAAVLVVVDGREAAKASVRAPDPAPSPSRAADSPPPERPRDDPPSVVPTRGPKRVDREDSHQQELERLSDQAQGKPPEEARRIYAGASPGLRKSELWQRFMTREEERLLGAERADGRRLLLRTRLRAAADLGRPARFEALAKVTPGDLIDVERERAWLKLRSKTGGGLDLSGFSPDQTTVEGRRCRVESFVGSKEGNEVRDAVDATLARVSAVFEREPPALRVGVLKGPETTGAKVDLATFVRRGETKGERIERVRLLVACWALERLYPGSCERWSGLAVAEALAGATLEGAGTLPTPLGRAARAVLSAAAPGARTSLADVLKGPDLTSDPTGASATRLATFALVECDGRAALLWPALREHLASGKAIPAALGSSRLEGDWAAFERAP